MTFEVREGDCVALMAAMPAGSVDAVVCDPPYGLEFMGKDWDRLDDRSLRARGENAIDSANRGMNEGALVRVPGFSRTREQSVAMQEWHQAWATEALRVLKPGGHLLAFGGTRTYHRLVCAVEDAGFEIRDTISWLYGSGFPKSLDVGKAIDKRPGVQRHAEFATHLRERMAAKGYTNTFDVAEAVIGRRTGAVANWQKYQWPEAKWWEPLRDLLDLDESWGEVIAEAERRKTGNGSSGKTAIWADGGMGEFDLTAPATPEATQWQGWGTALKPAMEPVVVARKPLSGTVAGNVLEHGTGALNVDGCRVGTEEALGRFNNAKPAEHNVADSHPNAKNLGRLQQEAGLVDNSGGLGRWPANVVLSHTEGCVQVGTRKVKSQSPSVPQPKFDSDEPGVSLDFKAGVGRNGEMSAGYADADGTETVGAWSCTPGCPVRLLDEQTGELTSGSGPLMRNGDKFRNAYGEFRGGDEPADVLYGDTGGASRFFYCAKSSRGERNAGLEGFEEQRQDPYSGEMPAVTRLDWGDPDAKVYERQTMKRNVHPTVKPISLMRWLVRLVTPPEVPHYVCPTCDNGVDAKSQADIPATKGVPDVREDVQAEGRPESVLLGEMPGAGSADDNAALRDVWNPDPVEEGADGSEVLFEDVRGREVCEAEDEAAMRTVRPDVHAGPDKSQGEVLREEVRGEGVGGESPEPQDRCEGVHPDLGAGSSQHDTEQLRDGAQAGHGGASRSAARTERGGPPHQRPEGRQSAKESSSDDETRTRPDGEAPSERDGVPPLPRAHWGVGCCARCGGPLELRSRRGRVLDCFTGSGTTGCAAVLEGFDFIGLEREPEYVVIAEARIAWWHKHRGDGEAAEILAAGEARDEVEATGQLGMFD